MKLEVGMYVRTEHNGICKLYREFSEDSVDIGIGILPEINGFFIDEKEVDYIEKEEILKASFDIIDILEVGDYVNGYKIGYIDDCKGAMREFYYDYENPNDDMGHWEEEIKSVITHEQMEQMAYKE